MSKFGLIRVLAGTTTIAALTLVLSAASPIQAASLSNCAANGIVAPCFEKVWSGGEQVRMTFLDFNPAPSNVPAGKFYVIAPQVHVPQGTVPFLHDHVIGDASPRNHGGDPVLYHAFFVLCSAQGISTGRCVPAMTSIPGLGIVPFAKSVKGYMLTSAEPIESPENSEFITIMDTGGEILAAIEPGQ